MIALERCRRTSRAPEAHDHQAPLAPAAPLEGLLTPQDDAAREISRAVRLRGARVRRAPGPCVAARAARLALRAAHAPPASRGARRGRAQGDDRRRHRHRAPAARHEGRRQRRGHSALEDPSAADQARHVGSTHLGRRVRRGRVGQLSLVEPAHHRTGARPAPRFPGARARSPSSRARRRSPGARARARRRVIFP